MVLMKGDMYTGLGAAEFRTKPDNSGRAYDLMVGNELLGEHTCEVWREEFCDTQHPVTSTGVRVDRMADTR